MRERATALVQAHKIKPNIRLKMKKNSVLLLGIASLVAIIVILALLKFSGQTKAVPPDTQPAAVPTAGTESASALSSEAAQVLAAYRKIIVLFADENKLTPAEKQAATQVGQELFHANRDRIDALDAAIADLLRSSNANRLDEFARFLNFVESDTSLFDADRLAFKEVLRAAQAQVAADSSLPAIRMHKRIGEDLDALAEIERNYEKEIRQIFGRFDARAIELKRERWDDYVAKLQKLYSREQILKDYGVILPSDAPLSKEAESRVRASEIDGHKLPPKTVVLTFDDGPHQTYTAEIAAILKQYGAPAVFFEVGKNLGTVGADGNARLGNRAAASRELAGNGYAIANHSYSHSQLSKQAVESIRDEVSSTDRLLKSVDPKRSVLFRFPYGARNTQALKAVADADLISVMWNVDSLDWADPLPSSIADRVMRTLDKEGRGILLFHDIHERTVKALPMVLDRLVANGYKFAGWNGSEFAVVKEGVVPAPAASAVAGYEDSYAIVVGIDNYAKWPKLQYAVRDADAVRQTLISNFGFSPERVFSIRNQEATRAGILAAFHDKLMHANIKKNDRVFFFFAGHGATKKLSSGRDLGYIVPVDSDPEQIAADAIPMTEIQNIAESLPAKHVMFVMDACYSGLGLTRGGASSNFLRDNAKRIGRQMLTAGGSDQLVADGGPNGHSVFTWALLQGLNGKADLNSDGLITATELAAYIAPAVANVAPQTPAFGSLPGSEGGDFVFELPTGTEFLSAQTTQLSSDAIALNSKLDDKTSKAATAPASGDSTAQAAPTQVVIKDLNGKDQTLVLPATVPSGDRQQAQRLNDRGLQFYREKKYAEAEAQFSEALKLRPNFALAANNLGFVYYKQGKFPEAARWFENTVKMDPSRAIAYVNLGDAYFNAGDKPRAAKAYKTYLEIAPAGPSASYVKEQLAR